MAGPRNDGSFYSEDRPTALSELRADNAEKQQALKAMRASLAPEGVLLTRINTLLDFVFGDPPEDDHGEVAEQSRMARTAFELEFESRIC
jgi:hypothetical protein